MSSRLSLAFLTICTSLAALTACGSSDGPETTPSASAPQSRTDAESDEVRYNAALEQLTEYQDQLPTYQRDPKLNDATRAFYTKYWVDPSYELKEIAALAKADVETRGAIKILSSKQQKVASTEVQLRQCVDYSPITVVEKGRKLPKNQTRPQWQYVTMQRQSASLPWKIATLDDSTKKDRPCDAS